jgi:hypothetical protein
MVECRVEPVGCIVTGFTISREFGSHMPFGRVELYLVTRHAIRSYFLVRPAFMTFHAGDVMSGCERERVVIKTRYVPARSIYCMTFNAIARITTLLMVGVFGSQVIFLMAIHTLNAQWFVLVIRCRFMTCTAFYNRMTSFQRKPGSFMHGK